MTNDSTDVLRCMVVQNKQRRKVEAPGRERKRKRKRNRERERENGRVYARSIGGQMLKRKH
jgi:hypothetical protein